MATAFVKPDMIRWALARSGVSENGMLESFPKLPEWLNGSVKPTIAQLKKFSSKTMTPFGYFYLASPPADVKVLPDFRTIGDEGVRKYSPELRATMEEMYHRVDWLSEDRKIAGVDPVDIVASFRVGTPKAAIVQAMLKFLEFPKNWAREESDWERAFARLRNTIDQHGVMVAVNGIVRLNTHRALDPTEFRGFAIVDKHAPLIFVNGADAKAAQMFTLAHELVHVFIGESGLTEETLLPSHNATEEYCNSVAAEFLVPEDYIRGWWKSHAASGTMKFTHAARDLKVSAIVIARRALGLNLIDIEEYFEFYRMCMANWVKLKSDDSSGGDFYKTHHNRLGESFARAVTGAAADARITYQQAFRLTGISGKTYDKFVNDLALRRAGAELR